MTIFLIGTISQANHISTEVLSNEAVILRINDVQPSDAGEYVCAVGPATDTYTLQVEGRIMKTVHKVYHERESLVFSKSSHPKAYLAIPVNCPVLNIFVLIFKCKKTQNSTFSKFQEKFKKIS